MEPSAPPPAAEPDANARSHVPQTQRGPFWLSAPFFQAVFLCLLAAFSALTQIRSGGGFDPVFATGIGLLLGFLLYHRRLFIPAAIVLPLGVVNQLWASKIIPGKYLEPAHLIALALGLLAITWAMRARSAWAAPGAWSPGVVVAVLGLALLAVLAPATAGWPIYSFWMPTVALGAFGLYYLFHLALRHTA